MKIYFQFKDTLYLRLFYSVVVWIIFQILRSFFDIYLSLILILTPASILTIYILYIDKVKFNMKNSIYFSISAIIYFIIVITIYPSAKLELIYVILVLQAGFEEILFRFCMLGVIKKYIDFKITNRTLIIVLLNSLIFSVSHTQYTLLIDYITIFAQSFIYGTIFLTLGIIPAIIAHALWNLYLPSIITQIPILIFAIIKVIVIYVPKINVTHIHGIATKMVSETTFAEQYLRHLRINIDYLKNWSNEVSDKIKEYKIYGNSLDSYQNEDKNRAYDARMKCMLCFTRLGHQVEEAFEVLNILGEHSRSNEEILELKKKISCSVSMAINAIESNDIPEVIMVYEKLDRDVCKVLEILEQASERKDKVKKSLAFENSYRERSIDVLLLTIGVILGGLMILLSLSVSNDPYANDGKTLLSVVSPLIALVLASVYFKHNGIQNRLQQEKNYLLNYIFQTVGWSFPSWTKSVEEHIQHGLVSRAYFLERFEHQSDSKKRRSSYSYLKPLQIYDRLIGDEKTQQERLQESLEKVKKHNIMSTRILIISLPPIVTAFTLVLRLLGIIPIISFDLINRIGYVTSSFIHLEPQLLAPLIILLWLVTSTIVVILYN